ncbi:mitochondrial import translocase, subunit Tom22 [Saccharata proteae CBS 121410]|uniref:Mitochondrial import translocase, subunit Tom22 n=1 Tax=Saccharata proteae CBS 121410 TaxID=1314787 RepID=A0A9P4LX47_9PEZI|nr:mitochondrial import translocase, subunit Tom22 [Saccharata proteae CBS 121410]
MVKLEEVPDEELNAAQQFPEDNDDWDTDSDSDAASETSSIAPDETLSERLAALVDIVPPAQRRFFNNAASNASSWFSTGLRVSGQCLWVMSSSALLLGVPWALAYSEDLQMAEMEREMKMQQSANDLLAPGAVESQQPAEAKPAL